MEKKVNRNNAGFDKKRGGNDRPKDGFAPKKRYAGSKEDESFAPKKRFKDGGNDRPKDGFAPKKRYAGSKEDESFAPKKRFKDGGNDRPKDGFAPKKRPEVAKTEETQTGDEQLLIRGRHEVIEALKAKSKIEYIVVSSGVRHPLLASVRELAREANVLVKELATDIFEKKYGEKSQGIIAICGVYEYCTLDDLIENDKNGIIVALNQVEDARNLGAIVRTVEASGCAGVILPKHRSAGMTEWAVRTAQGAASHTKVAKVGNLNEALELLKKSGYWILGLDGSGDKKYSDAVYTGKIVLVAGGENVGLGERVKKTCDEIVSIPMLGKTSSLNVSVSVGIAIYEVLRQKEIS